MRLSARVSLGLTALGLVVIPAVALVAWLFAVDEVRSSVDRQLQQQAERVQAISSREITQAIASAGSTGSPPPLARLDRVGDEEAGIILYRSDGTPLGSDQNLWSGEILEGLADGEEIVLTDRVVDGRTYRLATVSIFPVDDAGLIGLGGIDLAAIQLYNDTTAEEQALVRLAWRLGLVALLAVALVSFGSWWLGRRLARPVNALIGAAEQLAELDDVPGRIEINRRDELGRLADSFNRMSSAIEVSREQQRRLVADASHELRTPLTSLRMRTEFLASRPDLDDAQRHGLIESAGADVHQLTALVSDLIDLATDPHSDHEPPEPVRLADIVDTVAERSALASGRRIETDTDDAVAVVAVAMVRRAIQNLVDNAVKYSDDGPIVIRSHGGRIEVLDHGSGIAAEDRAHVFDRFFRSPKARSRPGNGIGLAIVQQVAHAHDGTTWVGDVEPGSGTVVGFSVAV